MRREVLGDCTHFTWTNFEGGTCWLKGQGVNPGAVDKWDDDAVCGWVNRDGQPQQPQQGSLNWETSGNVQWKKNCDFNGGDVGRYSSRGEECGGKCSGTVPTSVEPILKEALAC